MQKSKNKIKKISKIFLSFGLNTKTVRANRLKNESEYEV